MKASSPKVSVLIITYNHEQWIRQTLNSVLMQQVNFDYEVVIGEDASTDNTRNILLEYQQEHPDKIRLLLHDHNIGAQANFIGTFKACQGQYIALLDGDDYWISLYKLQKQVDLLDRHPEYTMCFHSIKRIYEEGSREPYDEFPPVQKESYTLADLLEKKCPVRTCAAMFRVGLFDEFPEWYYAMPIGDWPLFILHAQHGRIGYISDVMGVHRVHKGGVWSPIGRIQQVMTQIEAYDILKENLDSRYQKNVAVGQYWLYYLLAKIYLYEHDDLARARDYLMKCVLGYRYCKDVRGFKLSKILWYFLQSLPGGRQTRQLKNLIMS